MLLDCEHFFDGYKANPDYALACAKAAYEAGARWVVLCDTNGGTLPHEVDGDRRDGGGDRAGRRISASTRTTIAAARSPIRSPRSRPARGRSRAR